MHGSAPNMLPFDRKVDLMTYNRADNAPRLPAKPRPDFLVSRDFTSILPLAGDTLLA